MSTENNELVTRLRYLADRVNPEPGGLMREAADALEAKVDTRDDEHDEKLAELLQREYRSGTTVTNCMAHSGDIAKRPDDCSRCRTDLRNHMNQAIAINEFLNTWKDNAAELLATLDGALASMRERIRTKAQDALDRRDAASKRT